MKFFSILILVMATIIPVNGQLNYTKTGRIIPFSQSEKYKDRVDIAEIKSLKFPAYNNDSIFLKKNNGKSRNMVGSSFASGFNIDTIVDIRKYGKRYDIDEGTLWIYVIDSKNAKSLSPTIDCFKIPDGGYLSIISPNGADSPFTFDHNSQECLDYQSYRARILCNRAVIEYFEPKEVKSTPSVILRSITYYFAGALKKKMLQIKNQGHTVTWSTSVNTM